MTASPITLAPVLTAAQKAGDFTATAPASLTAPILQAAIALMPTSNGVTNANSDVVGGAIRLPVGDVNLGAVPLRLPNGVVAQSETPGSTYLRYTGSAYAVRLTSPGYQMSSGVKHLSINSTSGGIAYENCTSDVQRAKLIDLSICAVGYAIDLSPNNPAQLAYAETIEDVVIVGGSVRVIGRRTSINRLSIVNAPVNGKPFLELNGQGDLAGLWLEGDSGDQPLLKLTGTWDIRGMWAEAHFAKPHVQIILDNAQVTIDHTMFVQPQQPWQLINGSKLYCLGNLDAQDNGGGHPTGDARAKFLPTVYQCDATSAVYERGAMVVGQQSPQPVQLQSPVTAGTGEAK